MLKALPNQSVFSDGAAGSNQVAYIFVTKDCGVGGGSAFHCKRKFIKLFIYYYKKFIKFPFKCVRIASFAMRILNRTVVIFIYS